MRNNALTANYSAFIDRFDDVAVVNIYAASGSGASRQIDFTKKLACYETLNKGALASAKREMEKMEAQRLAA
jgi:hypothetical protein